MTTDLSSATATSTARSTHRRFPVEFRVDASGITGSKADLRVRYGTNGRPDPSIRPWPASPTRQWQSPDIEVRNAKNQADASWRNVPWVGNPNTVVATVKNGGTVLAPSVQVDFRVKNLNIGGAPEVFLGTQSQDIPAGQTRDFTTTWVPPSTAISASSCGSHSMSCRPRRPWWR